MADLREMFADAETASERGDRVEALKSAMDVAVERAEKGRGRTFDRRVNRMVGMDEAAHEAIETLQNIQKSVDPATAASIQASIDELSKDLQVGGAYTNAYFGGESGSPGNLRPLDLEGPAKILVPRFTPLRNEIPRVKGVGGARTYRRILGYSNANMGGVPDVDPFLDSEFNSGTAPSFGNLQLRRGQKISYAMDQHSVPYVEMSLSDLVTTKAYFSSLGYENLRGLSAMALLWAHMIAEEKAILFGRGSAAGYAGAFGGAAPAATGDLAVSGVNGTIPSATYTLAFTARAGVGETVPGTAAVGVALTLGQNAVVTVPAIPAGAYGLNVYVNDATSTYFLGFIPSGTTAATVTYSSLGVKIATAATIAASNIGGNTATNGYDGLLTVLTTAGVSGAVNSTAYTVATTGDKFIQDTCQTLYQNVYADPDEVWLNVVASRALGDFLKSQPSATATSFRIQVDAGGAIIGSNVTGVYNQSSPTRKMLDLRVHPYMPAGQSIIRSRTLDIPDSGIGDTTEVISVQEYQAYEWPQVQFTYDASTYWMGTLVHYAPAWSGAATALA